MGKLLGGGAKPKVDKEAQARQKAELDRLKSQEDQKKAAALRKRKGRASLISGSEEGLSDTLG